MKSCHYDTLKFVVMYFVAYLFSWLTDWHKFIASKHDNYLEQKGYRNRQKVVSKCTKTNKSKEKTIQLHKNKNQIITIL